MWRPGSIWRHRLEDGDDVDIAALNRETVRTLNELAAEMRTGGTDANTP